MKPSRLMVKCRWLFKHSLSLPLFCLLGYLWASTNTRHIKEYILNGSDLPTLYEAYAGDRLTFGLEERGIELTLNGQPIRLYSGSIHYFRVHPDYWRDRLRKLRAAGFNAVDTYIAWNLHEPQRGQYKFSGWLNISRFIEVAKEEDLLVILRPGPYMCAEWDFGGMPSWLLRDTNMVVRSNYPGFLEPALQFLHEVAVQVRHWQWSPAYGPQPIIAVQIENEFGSVRSQTRGGIKYLRSIRNQLVNSGLSHALLFTSDNDRGITSRAASIPGVLKTLHYKQNAKDRLKTLEALQPNRPLMVMELWPGWFDHWAEPHQTSNTEDFAHTLEDTLTMGASFNLYMFHGGTTFGFMPGANPAGQYLKQKSTVNSYDYDALLTEAGDYTSKYEAASELISKYRIGATVRHPSRPEETFKAAHQPIHVHKYLPWEDILKQIQPSPLLEDPINMEALDYNKENGQSYGFILYRIKDVTIRSVSKLTFSSSVRDFLYVVIDGKMITKPPRTASMIPQRLMAYNSSSITLNGDGEKHQIDLLVENMGRVNWGITRRTQVRKGIWGGPVHLDGNKLTGWRAYSLDFQENWMQSLTGWKAVPKATVEAPALYKSSLLIDSDILPDTFLELPGWTKGVLFLNNFTIGRYWDLGPTRTSYLPGPLFKTGNNEIIIFELFHPGAEIGFAVEPKLG